VKHRVLVVDDHEDTALLYAENLLAAGFEAEYATNANQALSIALRTHPDAMTIDLAMPEMDGCELARLLRSYTSTRDIRLVAVSAHAFDFSRYQVPPHGWDACVHKPCDPLLLVSTLRTVLAAVPAGKSGPVLIPSLGLTVDKDGTTGDE
jgi:CheY-like chemotaxis protein